MIDRYKLVTRHNPVLSGIDYKSPLSVGNGELAYTVDITGMQTLYDEYKEQNFPLCTMSQWGWHTTPVFNKSENYTLEDIKWTYYKHNGKNVKYAFNIQKGNGDVYTWLRENPHRLNLGKIGLIWKGKKISSVDIKPTTQELNLYEGIIDSKFSIFGNSCYIKTACHYENDIIGFKIISDSLVGGDLGISFEFPYGASDISGSDWCKTELHKTIILEELDKSIFINRILDADGYGVEIVCDQSVVFRHDDKHQINISSNSSDITLAVRFIYGNCDIDKIDKRSNGFNPEDVFISSASGWQDFWNNGGAIDFSKSTNAKANELERRVVLSQYLIAIQSSGSTPPQETGLTCNSWYGKFHLEMHLWHSAYLPMWQRSDYLERSLGWYKDHLQEAKDNAERNGYKGVRWPKMVSYEAVDSPSSIATLLIWQQPHILYMLELIYFSGKSDEFLSEYYSLVAQTADFMCDFASYNKEKDCYELKSPIIPVQETFDPETVLNPSFELAYWKFGLEIAVKWGARVGSDTSLWELVAHKMAKLPIDNGLYLSHEKCPETFVDYNRDHPSMLGAYGLINYEHVDRASMEKTLRKVIELWDFDTMWGWDFAMMAMTATRLGCRDLAIEILLKDSPKNCYMVSGNNYQNLRTDLPLYLPGNGSLLLAVTMMVAGVDGKSDKYPGFPEDGTWNITYENITGFPY